MNSCNPTLPTSPESPTPSTGLPVSSVTSARRGLLDLADKCRRTQGILPPTETLELLDIAEDYYNKLEWTRDELASLEWDINHPTSKDL